jgi:hypothetical protein
MRKKKVTASERLFSTHSLRWWAVARRQPQVPAGGTIRAGRQSRGEERGQGPSCTQHLSAHCGRYTVHGSTTAACSVYLLVQYVGICLVAVDRAVSAAAVSPQRSCATSWSQTLDVHAVAVPWRGSIAVLLSKHIHQDGPLLAWLLLHRNPRQGGAVISSPFPTANVQEDVHLGLYRSAAIYPK